MIMLEFGNKTGTDFYTDVMVSQINTILTETNEMYDKCYVAYIELHAFIFLLYVTNFTSFFWFWRRLVPFAVHLEFTPLLSSMRKYLMGDNQCPA